MIRNIIVPEYINSYYLFSRRIIGFSLERNTVYATVITAKGNKRIIEQCLQEAINTDPSTEFQVRAADAIKRIVDRVGSYNEAYSALPSNQVVFKELSLPITNLAKIKMILPFELEPLLPFSLSQATIDGIITAVDKEHNKAEVFVAAVRTELIEEQKNIFAAAGVPLQKITIDLLELINLYYLMPDFPGKEGAVGFVHIGLYATHIALFVGHKLVAVRVLQKGSMHLVRELSSNKNNENIESVDSSATIDLEHDEVMKEKAAKLLSDIPFTLETLISKAQPTVILNTVLLVGTGIDIKGMQQLISSLTNAPCIAMPINKILHNGTITAQKGVSVNNSYLVSLATALSVGITKEFNLNKEQEAEQYRYTLIKQFIAGIIFIVIIATSLAIDSILSTRKIKNEISASEEEAIKSLKAAFPALAQRRDITRLAAANSIARQEVNKEEAIWFALSPQNRVSIVTALQELSTRIDREGLGLELKRLVIDESNVVMEGTVKDFNAVRLLEDALNESGLFVTVPKLQEPKFMLTMPLNKKREIS